MRAGENLEDRIRDLEEQVLDYGSSPTTYGLKHCRLVQQYRLEYSLMRSNCSHGQEVARIFVAAYQRIRPSWITPVFCHQG